jgi:hypothetical protein
VKKRSSCRPHMWKGGTSRTCGVGHTCGAVERHMRGKTVQYSHMCEGKKGHTCEGKQVTCGRFSGQVFAIRTANISRLYNGSNRLPSRGDFRVILLSCTLLIFFRILLIFWWTRLSSFWSKCVDREGCFCPKIYEFNKYYKTEICL